MSLCLNPNCLQTNSDGNKFCQKCGSKLLLQERYQAITGFSNAKSTRGVDYSKLEQLLKQGKWKEADEETARVMLQVANRVSKGWLDYNDINNFPCEDLRTIDQLWLKYSNGKFGFSVQKNIWLEIGGLRDYDTVCEFGDRVGWCKGGSWMSYNSLTFNLSLALRGHLPRRWCGVGLRSKVSVWDDVWEWWVEECEWDSFSLAQRLVTCNT